MPRANDYTQQQMLQLLLLLLHAMGPNLHATLHRGEVTAAEWLLHVAVSLVHHHVDLHRLVTPLDLRTSVSLEKHTYKFITAADHELFV